MSRSTRSGGNTKAGKNQFDSLTDHGEDVPAAAPSSSGQQIVAEIDVQPSQAKLNQV